MKRLPLLIAAATAGVVIAFALWPSRTSRTPSIVKEVPILEPCMEPIIATWPRDGAKPPGTRVTYSSRAALQDLQGAYVAMAQRHTCDRPIEITATRTSAECDDPTITDFGWVILDPENGCRPVEVGFLLKE